MNFLKGLLMPCLFVLQACHFLHSGVPSDDLNAVQGDAAVDFELVMKEVIQPRCLECHSAGASASFLPLENYAQVKQSAAAIKAAIADDSMPKNRAPLTLKEKQIINSWVDAGAPETVVSMPTPQPTAPSVPPEESPSLPARDWLTVKTLVLDPACLRCHSAPANRAGINVETYQNVLKDIGLIEAVILDGSMPLRGSLSPEQKALILEWIDNGAPEFAR